MAGASVRPMHNDRMTDTPQPAPVYPWGDALPAPGTLMTLRPGLHWLRMPLPFALNHINLWALDDDMDGPGWTLVDAGIGTEPLRAHWQTLWQGPLAGKPLQRMLVTHMHPDHVGNAQWLISQFSAPQQPARLWMSLGDHFGAMVARQSTTGYGGPRAAEFFRTHGLNRPGELEQISGRIDYYARLVPELPASYHRLMDGTSLRIGTRTWRCMAGYGHSPEHMALMCDEDHILISGDMLLPRISTNISVVDLEPEADALGLFLNSIDRFLALPADTLALPSHGLPFTGIHERVRALHAHHQERLQEVLDACRGAPQTAADLLPVLFRRPLDVHQTTFAMGESVAHLNHLWLRGQLRRVQDDDGVWRFSVSG
jgi:glyoxylase-like metal-dependent hydrolase (beta-lactamase superfamily II)